MFLAYAFACSSLVPHVLLFLSLAWIDGVCTPLPASESFYSVLFEIAPYVEGLFTRSKRVQGEVSVAALLFRPGKRE